MLVCIYAYPQNCEKTLTTKTDPVSGKTTKEGQMNVGGGLKMGFKGGEALDLLLKNNEGQYCIDIVLELMYGDFVPDENNAIWMNKGDSILFKFESGQILTLYAKDKVSAVAERRSFSFGFVFASAFNLTKEELILISESPVTFLRVTRQGKTIDRTLDKKEIKGLQTIAKCLLM